MKITILCDNTAPASLGILGEHGFAALIENKSASYLFDTGQGHTLLHNARCLRKNLEKITAVFLSHGHYDHTGGLKSIAEIKKEIEVWAHPEVFLKRFARHEKNGRLILRPVGIPYSKRYYEARGVHFSYATSVHEVSPHMYCTGEVPRVTSFEKQDPRLVIKDGGELITDLLRDDQSLILETAKGLVIILGCAHAGLINILTHIQKNFPAKKIYMLLGGTHLGFLNHRQIDKTIAALKEFPIKHIGASH